MPSQTIDIIQIKSPCDKSTPLQNCKPSTPNGPEVNRTNSLRTYQLPFLVMLCLLSFNLVVVLDAIAKFSQSHTSDSQHVVASQQHMAQCYSPKGFCVVPQSFNFP